MVRKKRLPVYKKSWNNLTPRQKMFRERSLDVLTETRKTRKPLSKIAKDYGLSAGTVIRNTDAFKKINNRWIPKKYDKISRVMKINENGKEHSIEINDSRNASKIGRYQNDVKQFLEMGDVSHLLKYKTKKIKDASGKIHFFETDPESILEIQQGIEEPEFYEIYGDGN